MKNPLLLIAIGFLVLFFVVGHYAENRLSDEPVQLTRANPPTIVMFGTRSCGYCQLAKQFFARHQLPYTEHDIELSDKHRELFYLMGGRGTPLLIVNGEIIHGFEENLIRAAL
ncbi:MAG: glutaredoxin family protein [Gammaproteobacteria bacterium]|nr:MAG: glutaredoxin family protein [Gammaproteobacteria bacterium]